MASLTNTRGIFALFDVRVRQNTNNWDVKYGYFGGGSGPVSLVNRIDYSNDTVIASTRGPLSLARFALSATGNGFYGWFAGGLTPSPGARRTVDRIDYSNDTTTASPRGPLAVGRHYLAATGNNSFGWFACGDTATAPITSVSSIERITYANDTATASARSNLTPVREIAAATGNNSYGWIGGGLTPASFNPSVIIHSSVNRIDYANDTAFASSRGPFSVARYGTGATGNNFYGWFGGGFTTGTVSTVDRIDYSNDTATTSPRGPLSLARSYGAATGNSSYGWFGGGFGNSIVDRINYSNDTVTASVRGSLSIPVQANGASSASANALRANRFTPQQIRPFGYFGGGNFTSTVDRIDYSNDTATASVRGPLSLARRSFGSTANLNYSWFIAGQSVSSNVTTVDRIDYSNDTATASPRGSSGIARSQVGATGNSSYGWCGGGSVSIPVSATISSVSRIDYSNDTATASGRGPLSSVRQSPSAMGNSSYGWFTEGITTPATKVDRIDYSNDLVTTSIRGPLSKRQDYSAATGNISYGWIIGGTTTADRIDYSNDTATASSRGSLSLTRNGLSATGNNNYGWFGGGFVSTVDRIDYSNDTATASVRGPLSAARYYLAASSPLANAILPTFT